MPSLPHALTRQYLDWHHTQRLKQHLFPQESSLKCPSLWPGSEQHGHEEVGELVDEEQRGEDEEERK